MHMPAFQRLLAYSQMPECSYPQMARLFCERSHSTACADKYPVGRGLVVAAAIGTSPRATQNRPGARVFQDGLKKMPAQATHRQLHAS